MKKIVHAVLLLPPLALAPLASAENRYYIGASYGINNQDSSSNDGTFSSDFTTGAVTGVNPPLTIAAGSPVGWKTNFDDGGAWSFVAGLNMSSFRIELEYAFTDNDIDNHRGVSAAGLDLSAIDAGVLISGNTSDLGATVAALVADGRGELETETLYVNVYYDFDLGNKITPFIGAGIGSSKVTVSFKPSSVEIIDDNDRVVVYQLIGGIGYDLSDNINLYASFRYRDGDEASVDASLLPAEFDIDNESMVYDVGLRYSF